uniref:LirA/MavJ family T4SS effector n=1 Tax=Aquiflexum sp. TaxID=1872584 RepID=UPI0035934C76
GQEKHLPHEAWHVVQQKQGRVKPTLQMSKSSGNPAFAGKGGVNVNDDAGLEKEADVMGGKALGSISSESSPNIYGLIQITGYPVIQCNDGMKEEVNLKKTKKRYRKDRSPLHPLTPTTEENIVSDAIRVRDYLRDMDNIVKPALQQLENDILEQTKMSTAKKPNSRHLTKALAVREKQCGLAPTKSNYTRILSSKDFAAEAAKGALFNDWGALTAALEHGEFTHRIQWYIIMFAMSHGFNSDIASSPSEGFTHTPKELLIAINAGGVSLEQKEVGNSGIRPTKQKDGHGLWDVLFDRPSLGIKSSLTKENIEIGITDPERFMYMLDTREEGVPEVYKPIFGSLKGEAPVLSEILSRRQALRRKQKKSGKNNSGLNPEEFENRKIASGQYELEGKGLLVRNQAQSLVGSKAKDEKFVPYAKTVSIE